MLILGKLFGNYEVVQYIYFYSITINIFTLIRRPNCHVLCDQGGHSIWTDGLGSRGQLDHGYISHHGRYGHQHKIFLLLGQVRIGDFVSKNK